jgi:hypothetical protein
VKHYLACNGRLQRASQRLKVTFDKEEFSFPQMVIHQTKELEKETSKTTIAKQE